MSGVPAGCVVRYRICTGKSILGFGKYADLRVGDILAGLRLPSIEKPGTDPEAFYAWKRKRSEGFTEEERMHGAFIKARGKRAMAVAKLIRAEKETRFTKGQLQAINHGHRK
ncbi:MAG: hypothetical protein IJ713_07605 [Oscillibacter sp.]|nr:hypothetical protein [Oscillibacter sp.]MBR1690623.1 hypothetical protein [Oscillibacter sp.]